ncbi:Mitochondrial import inner membrane translocase subunit Tim13 [Platanthera guangdongensis]|uniref:Mitochondrial import inner membrane translocase subunit Tim13 n=1 Tax=Platanthera guangdongensis TaxID=2320717 RepID=A0ABR2MC87_9ASPA
MDPFSSSSSSLSSGSSGPSPEVMMDQLKTQLAQAYAEEFLEEPLLENDADAPPANAETPRLPEGNGQPVPETASQVARVETVAASARFCFCNSFVPKIRETPEQKEGVVELEAVEVCVRGSCHRRLSSRQMCEWKNASVRFSAPDLAQDGVTLRSQGEEQQGLTCGRGRARLLRGVGSLPSSAAPAAPSGSLPPSAANSHDPRVYLLALDALGRQLRARRPPEDRQSSCRQTTGGR